MVPQAKSKTRRTRYATDEERKIGRAAYNKGYRQTKKGRLIGRAACKRYRESEKGKATRRRYCYSKIGRTCVEQSQKSTILKRGCITLSEYNRMFIAQKGCCALCDRHQSAVTNRLAIDHDHKTGVVRGLLCTSCNLLLGWLEKIERIKFIPRANIYRKN